MKLTHKNVSFIKSGLRIVAGLSLLASAVVLAGLFLILAEVLGILEEVVEE
jgi:hypothetical protein